MDADETADLLEEVEMLRRRVAELSEAVADYRARGLQQQMVIARLEKALRQERTARSVT